MTKTTKAVEPIEPEALSLSDACKTLGVAEVTLMALIQRGDLKVECSADGDIVGVFVS